MEEKKHGRFWVGHKEKRSGKLTVAETMKVFFAWLSVGKSTKAASEETGVSWPTVIQLVKRGAPIRGIPPFRELAGWSEMNMILAAFAKDASLDLYRYEPRKTVVELLQICDGIRKKLKDAIVAPDGIKIKSMREALDLVKSLQILDRIYSELASKEKIDLNDLHVRIDDGPELQPPPENPPVKERTEETGPELNFEKMSIQELQNWRDAHKGAEASG